MKRGCTFIAVCLFVCILSVESLASTTLPNVGPHKLIVVGKIIIDEYGKPGQIPAISIGGGGPQAAFGAALALASVSSYDDDDHPPPRQPVTFVAPVGDDWIESDTDALHELLGDAIESIELMRGSGLMTPRIQLWHDDEQCIQWKALFDSFGPEGADELWANRPSSDDILTILENDEQKDATSHSCHVILEGGENGAGKGGDIQFLLDDEVQKQFKFLGIEPVAFADDKTGRLSPKDADSITSRIEKLAPSVNFISPDNEIYQAIDSSFWSKYEVAIRQGPKGSLIVHDGRTQIMPVATLNTADGQPINPTGAGNSYAGAMSALRSTGASLEDAACIATAVGAVFCEYKHIPPWSFDTIRRVQQAASEVRLKVS